MLRNKFKLFVMAILLVGCHPSQLYVNENPKPTPSPNPGGELVLHWLGPDHPEDFERFGGFTGYYVHWSTSPIAENYGGTCESILDEHGRPGDKYPSRFQVLASNSGCKSNVVKENVPGKPEYGTRTFAHECTVSLGGLPKDIPLYMSVSVYAINPTFWDFEYWGCPSREFTVTIPSSTSKSVYGLDSVEGEIVIGR